MNENKLLQENIIIELLEWLEYQSKDTIQNMSKLINKKRRELYPESRNKKLGEKSKRISSEKFDLIIKNENQVKLQLIYKIMYYMGLRVSEVVEIKNHHIINNNLTIYDVKGNKIKSRVIPKRLRNELNEYIITRSIEIGRNYNYVFYGDIKKGKLSKDWIRKKFRENTLKLGINEIYDYSNHNNKKRNLYLYSTHSLRHSFANRFYELSGRDIEKTRIAMGHSLIKDTQNYIKGSIEEVNKIMENI